MSEMPQSDGSTYPSFQRERTEERRKLQLASLWHARLKYSEQDTWRYRRMLPSYYDSYRGVITGRAHSFNNNVNFPTLLAMVEADTARKFRAMYGGPSVQFEGSGATGSSLQARKQQALYYQQIREDGGFLKGYRVLKAAALYGTAVVETGHKYLVRPGVKFEMVPSPVDGKQYKIGRPHKFVDFDGPSSVQHDLLDFFPEPGKVLPSEWNWACSRVWKDLDEVEALVASGQLPERAEFFRLKREGSMTSDLDADVKQLRGLSMMPGGGNGGADPYGRPVMLVTAYGWIPSELAPDGIAFRKMVIANNSYVLLDEPFPYTHGRLDYIFQTYSPFLDNHYFMAPGKIEVALPIAHTINKIMNGVLDGIDLTLHPWMFMNEDALLDPRNLGLRAGRVITVRGNPSEMIMPGQFNMQGMQFGLEATTLLDRHAQKGTGIVEDVVQGMGGGRETARGVLARAEAVSNRLDCETALFEEMFAVPQADAYMELNRQHMDAQREAVLLGSVAETDSVTGRQYTTGEAIGVDPADVLPRFRARAVGTSSRLNKAIDQQNAQLMMQSTFQAASAGGPAMLGRLNLMGWVRYIAQKMEQGAAVNDLVYEDPQQAAASVAAMMEANGAGAAAEEADIARGGPIEDGAPSGMQGPDDMASLMGTLGGGLQR